MEPRRWRPKFFNPFTERRLYTSHLPVYRGLFRVLPLHRWKLDHIQKVLGYAAVNPSLFGFPDAPTCIVNTAYFLPSLRSRTRGVWAFGTERGCKSIIVPGSCSAENFDEIDARLIEPLFRWNPGVEYVYLSQYCQPMAPRLVPLLARCHHIREITLEGWNDAVAVNRILMACRQVEVLDTYSMDDPPRDWQNELSVQALTTMLEMHPKLRALKSHRLYLGDMYVATQFSRCKHNLALVPFSCDYVLVHYGFFLILLCLPGYLAYKAVRWAASGFLSEAYVWFWSVMAFIVTVVVLVAVDMIGWRYRGRAWVHMHRYLILARRRISIMMRTPSGALTVKS